MRNTSYITRPTFAAWPLLCMLTVLMGSCKKDDDMAASGTGSAIHSITDIAGNRYQTVRIGGQRWMAEDLRTTHYRDGTYIPTVTENVTWSSQNVGAKSYYQHDIGLVAVYGMLYNWHAVNSTRGICPEGWHVPTDDDWKVLESAVGMPQTQRDTVGMRGVEENSGGRLKAVTPLWQEPNTGATNETGFSALPGGFRTLSGGFSGIALGAFWWSATAVDAQNAWRRSLSRTSGGVERSSSSKRTGYCIRCVQD